MKQTLPILVVVIGVALMIVGAVLPVPGEHLGYAEYDFAADSRFSEIERYVGGDAYNYIIGSNMVGMEIAVAKIAKAIFFVIGVLVMCIGFIGLNNVSNQEVLNASIDKLKEEIVQLKEKSESKEIDILLSE